MLKKLTNFLRNNSLWIYIAEIILFALVLFTPYLTVKSYDANYIHIQENNFFLFSGIVALGQNSTGASPNLTVSLTFASLMTAFFFVGIGFVILGIIFAAKKTKIYPLPFLFFAGAALIFESTQLIIYVHTAYSVFANAGFYAAVLLTLLNVLCFIIKYAKPLAANPTTQKPTDSQ